MSNTQSDYPVDYDSIILWLEQVRNDMAKTHKAVGSDMYVYPCFERHDLRSYWQGGIDFVNQMILSAHIEKNMTQEHQSMYSWAINRHKLVQQQVTDEHQRMRDTNEIETSYQPQYLVGVS